MRWDFVWQRPQHLLSRAARTYRVIVFEEPIVEAIAEPRLDMAAKGGGVTVATPVLPEGLSERGTMAAQRKLLDAMLAETGQPSALWYYSPMAMAFSSHLTAKVVVYDCMDELTAFKNAPVLLPLMERRLFKQADLVFTGGVSLYEAKKGRHRSVHAFPSSIDAAHFARARREGREDPADQASIPHPRLGFFGVIDERMDVELVAEAAGLRPDWHFVMLGPVVKIDPASLPRRDNIHWLGGKDYQRLPDYLAGWDVGIMPFALNEATRFISPTKTPEFLAAGAPVVSTAIRDVVRPYGDNGLVEIADGPRDFVDKAAMLMERPREAWLAKVDRHLAAGSWDKTWASMQKMMRDVVLAKSAAGERRGQRPAATAEGAVHV
ncbi:glycosyltransferase family 1 protein [Alsobacter ponti]|uniref:glycosyltransferase family 1 protein n=1 Tax=Alsobacter ponti TaxID=2962936 RepID=UPI0020C8438A|nr:glycosyltransferase family 1 protein [Alsobacter ponti]